MTPLDESLNAYSFLTDLQTSVGARLTGTPAEAKAVAWLENHCRMLGVEPETETFQYQPELLMHRVRSLGLVYSIVVLTVLSLTLNTWSILLGIALAFVVFGLLWRRLARSAAKSEGRNMFAGVTRPWHEIVKRPPARVVILCAHYDTAPSAPAWRRRLGQLNDAAAGLAFLGVLGLTLFCIVYGILLAIPGLRGLATTILVLWRSAGFWLVLAAGLPGTVIVTLAALTYRPAQAMPENPGADDNGSGVAVVLSLTNDLKQRPPADTDVVVALWGVEEGGVWGSEAFVDRHKNQFDPANTIVLNVDGVGRGTHLVAVSGQGVLRRRAVDSTLLQKWEEACRSIGASTIREWLTPLTGSSDHAAWLDAGFHRALSIGRGDLVPIALPLRILNRLLGLPTGAQQANLSHIHSSDDSLQNIRPESLEETRKAILVLLSRI
ncbi:MAG: M28 family peptidase [Anaerolineales bacterium]|nr:M28 family peptidase [Anaerolineales bacterium]